MSKAVRRIKSSVDNYLQNLTHYLFYKEMTSLPILKVKVYKLVYKEEIVLFCFSNNESIEIEEDCYAIRTFNPYSFVEIEDDMDKGIYNERVEYYRNKFPFLKSCSIIGFFKDIEEEVFKTIFYGIEGVFKSLRRKEDLYYCDETIEEPIVIKEYIPNKTAYNHSLEVPIKKIKLFVKVNKNLSLSFYIKSPSLEGLDYINENKVFYRYVDVKDLFSSFYIIKLELVELVDKEFINLFNFYPICKVKVLQRLDSNYYLLELKKKLYGNYTDSIKGNRLREDCKDSNTFMVFTMKPLIASIYKDFAIYEWIKPNKRGIFLEEKGDFFINGIDPDYIRADKDLESIKYIDNLTLINPEEQDPTRYIYKE
jgi:hypothetical protein